VSCPFESLFPWERVARQRRVRVSVFAQCSLKDPTNPETLIRPAAGLSQRERQT
jgi:hypothetical protein